MIDSLFRKPKDQARLGRILEECRRLDFEEGHSQQVSSMAVWLFDALKPLHELAEAERFLLASAGILHDIGIIHGFDRHHKSSRDMVLEMDFPFTKRERLLVANLVRYHRKGLPKAKHALFQELDAADKKRVRKLASLLRMADALDREHHRKIRGVRAEIHSDRVVLFAETSSELVAETWALEKKSDLFTEVFSREVQLLPSMRNSTR